AASEGRAHPPPPAPPSRDRRLAPAAAAGRYPVAGAATTQQHCPLLRGHRAAAGRPTAHRGARRVPATARCVPPSTTPGEQVAV
ncbi:unnamed protein product, partial [Urochloa humidicola]